MTDKFYAHSLAGRPQDEWETLERHLASTAELAESFAKTFAPGWGHVVGLWHDLGKYQRTFQQLIRGDSEASTSTRVDHSSVGAVLAWERGAKVAACAIAGHHGGLANYEDLRCRLAAKRDLLSQARKDGLPAELERVAVPDPPGWVEGQRDRATVALWTRFLFSALVDADFLTTERFYAGGKERDLGVRPGLAELKERLNAYLDSKTSGAERTPVNEMRARVLAAARAAAADAPGAFSLTVPTGGGKTLSSLAFALEHAVRHGLKRVIVVIPYTSIIEQTAKEYRRALGEEAVLEHHTNADPEKETQASRLAAENWDAPIVVTTSVQFFESLYGNRTSRCRKVHRIARSAVVFDEVQTFPVKLLDAVKHTLRELPQRYGATTVFCTATQPVLLDGVREIVPDVAREFGAVAGRCEVAMPKSEARVSWDELARELRGQEQVLAIVHRRDDAQRLAELAGEDCLHLSARMCPAHRSARLEEIRARLKAGAGCRVVSTQLVEAGVDVDFPVVYRAFAGADSLAQAAGRCNREGKGTGTLHVFIAPTRPPRGILRTAEERARQMWKTGGLDLRKPETFRRHFELLYQAADQDGAGVMAAEREMRFEDVAALFRMIEDAGEAVVAPYGDWEQRVEDVRERGISRERMRRLQPLMVSLFPGEIRELEKAGAVEKVADAFWAVTRPFRRVYSDRWGFGWQGGFAAEPEALIA